MITNTRTISVNCQQKSNPNRRDALKFESGKNSLTNQIFRKSLKVLVVDKNGVVYEKEDWPKSQTFRQTNQANLMIADNRTREYAESDDENKECLSKVAWGSLSQVR